MTRKRQNMGKLQKEWFEDWFDSPYYDLLYQKRNESEAAYFLDNLLEHLPIAPGIAVLDLACGKGRHSVYLHQKGYWVTGMDLSQRSISYARQFESDRLSFVRQDMRVPLAGQQFSLILNLFTSFGYFNEMEDNVKVLKAVHQMLLPKGLFVLDYLNGEKIAQALVKKEHKHFAEANFVLSRKVQDGFIVKDIELHLGKEVQHFQEKVQLLSLPDFQWLFAEAGLRIISVLGDYALTPYDANTSDRIILIATN